MSPIDLLREAVGKPPEEQRRLLREALTALPPWEGKMEGVQWLREADADNDWPMPIGALIDCAVRSIQSPAGSRTWLVPAHLAAALAQLPGTLTEADVHLALAHVAVGIDTSSNQNTTAAVITRIQMAGIALGMRSAPEQMTAVFCPSRDLYRSILAALFRTGAALTDVIDRIKAGEKVGAALIAERHLREALSIATGGSR